MIARSRPRSHRHAGHDHRTTGDISHPMPPPHPREWVGEITWWVVCWWWWVSHKSHNPNSIGDITKQILREMPRKSGFYGSNRSYGSTFGKVTIGTKITGNRFPETRPVQPVRPVTSCHACILRYEFDVVGITSSEGKGRRNPMIV